MTACEACQAHRRRWMAHAGRIERAWLIMSPLVIIVLLAYQIVTGH